MVLGWDELLKTPPLIFEPNLRLHYSAHKRVGVFPSAHLIPRPWDAASRQNVKLLGKYILSNNTEPMAHCLFYNCSKIGRSITPPSLETTSWQAKSPSFVSPRAHRAISSRTLSDMCLLRRDHCFVLQLAPHQCWHHSIGQIIAKTQLSRPTFTPSKPFQAEGVVREVPTLRAVKERVGSVSDSLYKMAHSGGTKPE